MDNSAPQLRDVITAEHAEQHRLQLEAIHKLTNEFASFRAKMETEIDYLKNTLGDNYNQLKARVDGHGKEIDILNISVARNKEAHDASLRSAKLVGAILGGLLLAVEVGVMILALAGIGGK